VSHIDKFLRKGISSLKAYIPGKPIEDVQAELGLSDVAKLASNETPIGPSPMAVEAAHRELAKINLYPEGPATVLRNKMARRLSIEPEMITFSNGADNCLTLVSNAFIDEGDEVVMAEPTFSCYQTLTVIMGGRPVQVKLRNLTHDLDAMLAAVTKKTKLVFVCNPNNPTGTIVKRSDLERFISRLPGHVLLVLDEAYFEFASDHDYPDSVEYIKKGMNVIGLRTFSKIYGIAGLRIGYALGSSEFIGALNKVREPFPVSRIAQAAALAALDDDDYRAAVLKNNEEGKAYLMGEFERMGLPFAPSQTNFIFVDLKMDCRQAFDSILRKGIIIRPGHIWNSPTCARVTIGTMDQNRKFIRALEECRG